MIESVLNSRIVENKDWATILFILGFALIVITKSAFEVRFNDFKNLIVSDKYIKVYKDSSNLLSGFTILLFFVQLISIAFFIQLIMHYLGNASKTDWVLFVQIITFLTVFILSKFLIEKIIATTFDIEEFTEQFNLQKVSYRTYISILILPIDIILYYNNFLSINLIYGIIAIVLTLNIATYFISLKNYQNLLIGKLFYFILYLCALEIAPYYFMYYWITKN